MARCEWRRAYVAAGESNQIENRQYARCEQAAGAEVWCRIELGWKDESKDAVEGGVMGEEGVS